MVFHSPNLVIGSKSNFSRNVYVYFSDSSSSYVAAPSFHAAPGLTLGMHQMAAYQMQGTEHSFTLTLTGER